MRRIFVRILAACLAAMLIAGAAIPVMADVNWNADNARMIDKTGLLNDNELSDLEKRCQITLEYCNIDVPMYVTNTSEYEGSSLEDLADKIWNENGYGFGDTKKGVMTVYDADTNEMAMKAYGGAEEIYTDNFISQIIDASVEKREKNGIWGVMFMPVTVIKNYQIKIGEGTEPPAEEESEEVTKDAGEEVSEVTSEEAASEGQELLILDGESDAEGQQADVEENLIDVQSEKPDWYPEDPQNFVKYHDDERSRVVDEADIFTDEEEAKMAELIAGIRNDFDKDVVIFTSMTSWGMGEELLAMDFYDFNGYGIGDDFEGVCLCVVMDPADRGWCMSTTGPVSRGLHTESVANDLDDVLYDYFVNARYGEGVIDWIGNIATLYEYGYPFVPSWYPPMDAEVERSHNADISRIIDETGILTEEQKTELDERCRKVSEKMGTDVVINVTDSYYWMSGDTYADSFYKTNGYGLGDNYDGILLTINRGGYGYSASSYVLTVFGTAPKKLTSVNYERLNRQAGIYACDSVYDCADVFLKNLDHMARTGRIARTTSYWIFIAVVSIILGFIAGLINQSKAVKSMATPTLNLGAANYVVSGSLIVKAIADRLVGRHTVKTYSPKTESSSSGSSRSSGGGSSYSSHSTGSSGTSHTTSGRKF